MRTSHPGANAEETLGYVGLSGEARLHIELELKVTEVPEGGRELRQRKGGGLRLCQGRPSVTQPREARRNLQRSPGSCQQGRERPGEGGVRCVLSGVGAAALGGAAQAPRVGGWPLGARSWEAWLQEPPFQ